MKIKLEFTYQNGEKIKLKFTYQNGENRNGCCTALK